MDLSGSSPGAGESRRGSASGGEEARFMEVTCTQGLYPCSLMAVGVY
jgi:hypothetical protein